MSDLEFLLLILAGYYLFECTFWIRPGGLVFSSQFGEKHRHANLRRALLRNHDGGALFGNLLPTGHACVSEQWPLSLSPEGVYAYVSQALGSDGRPLLSEKYVPCDDIRRVETHGASVYLNGVLFVRLASAAFARFVATTIRNLSEAPAEQRAAIIDEALEQHFDKTAAARRLADFRADTRVLQVTCLAALFFVFGFFPLVLWLQPKVELLPLLLVYAALGPAVIVQFRMAHCRLYPQARAERIKHMLLMMISPADLLHARDWLGRTILGCVHPLVVCRLLCRDDDFQQLACEVVRDLEFPILPICPVDDSGPMQTESWFRERLKSKAEAFLKAEGFLHETALHPPEPHDERTQSYCPRCLGEYELAAGACYQCGDRPLVPVK